MAKRRTKSDKKNAKHNFTYTWSSDSIDDTRDPTVKRHFNLGTKSEKPASTKAKKAMPTASKRHFDSITKEVVKSISLALLIVSLELVIYFVS